MTTTNRDTQAGAEPTEPKGCTLESAAPAGGGYMSFRVALSEWHPTPAKAISAYYEHVGNASRQLDDVTRRLARALHQIEWLETRILEPGAAPEEPARGRECMGRDFCDRVMLERDHAQMVETPDALDRLKQAEAALAEARAEVERLRTERFNDNAAMSMELLKFSERVGELERERSELCARAAELLLDDYTPSDAWDFVRRVRALASTPAPAEPTPPSSGAEPTGAPTGATPEEYAVEPLLDEHGGWSAELAGPCIPAIRYATEDDAWNAIRAHRDRVTADATAELRAELSALSRELAATQHLLNDSQGIANAWADAAKRARADMADAEQTVSRLNAERDALASKLAEAERRAEALQSELDDLRAHRQEGR